MGRSHWPMPSPEKLSQPLSHLISSSQGLRLGEALSFIPKKNVLGFATKEVVSLASPMFKLN